MCHAEYGLCVNLYILLLITHKEPPQKKKEMNKILIWKGHLSNTSPVYFAI